MEKGFTLVIPLYNKVNVFRNTLESILHNHGTYPFKCIIVDDDSTDGSSEIGEEYDEKYPDIFMYIKKKHRGHKGPVYARNLGIKLAETEYIGFLDCDDELCAGFIDRACNFLDNNPEYNMYACGQITCEYGENGEKNYHWYKPESDNIRDFKSYVLYQGIDIHHSTHIYKTELVKKYPFIDCFNEDVVFKLRYIYYNEPIYYDNSTYESFIWNTIYSNSQDFWYRKDKGGLVKLFETLEEVIPNFEYTVEMIDNNNFYLKNKKI